ncbi:Gustatory receptor 29d [Halyomorpha halys]|nr:Gustatory receptor 29d [Halyomorpha halys]
MRMVRFSPAVPMKRLLILTTKPKKAGNKLFQFTKQARIIFSLSGLIGIFPFRLTRERASLSIPFAVCSIIANCFLIFYVTNNIIFLFENNYISKSVPQGREKVILMLVLISSTGSYIYSTLTSFSRARYLNVISEELEHVDRLMYRTCPAKKTANYKISTYVGAGLVCLYAMNMLFLQINSGGKYHPDDILIYSSILLVASQFSALADVITSRVRELSHCQKHIHLMGYFRQRCDVVVALTEIHSKLCDVCTVLQNSYKRILTVLVTVCFIKTVMSLFYVYIILIINEDYNKLFDTLRIGRFGIEARLLIHITSLCFTVCTMWVIVSDTTEISVEIEKFYVILYRLMIHDKTKILLENKRLTTYIAVKRQVTFSACGFFNLDYKLLHSILAAVTTYFVIFISWD